MSEWLEKYKLAVGLCLVGLVFIGIGVFWWKVKGTGGETKVEILSGRSEGSATGEGKLTLDVEGAVVSPGIYQLAPDSRVADALKAAGGLIEGADKDWVQKNLNQAEKLKDGMKIYIPNINSQLPVTNDQSNNKLSNDKVDINSATEGGLDVLPGIGPVTAKKIISGRPYGRIEELIERKVVTQKVWEGIKDLVGVW